MDEFFQVIFPSFQVLKDISDLSVNDMDDIKTDLKSFYIEKYNHSLVIMMHAALKENLVPHPQYDPEYIESIF